jgi:hypothetical protein
VTAAEKAVFIATRVEELRRELRLPHDFAMHDIGRLTFDQLPGEEETRDGVYWKTPLSVTFFAKTPPVLPPAEELAQLEREIAERQARARELRLLGAVDPENRQWVDQKIESIAKEFRLRAMTDNDIRYQVRLRVDAYQDEIAGMLIAMRDAEVAADA